MKISVAMATYNGEKFIKKQLESIKNQVLEADEVIICDDGSNDSTIEIIENFIASNILENSWFLIKNQTNLGYINNFIQAISLTTGDYIFLSDQDDIFYPEKFKEMIEIMSANNDIKLLNAGFELIDDNGIKIDTLKTKAIVKRKKVNRLDFKSWLYESMFPGFSMCLHSDIRNRLKDVSTENCYGHDQLICLIALELEGNYETNKILSGHRMHNKNATGRINSINNYNMINRIKQKEIELSEYKKLKQLIIDNDIKNTDFTFVEKRKQVLKKRIDILKRRDIIGAVIILFTNKVYPKRTVLGDIIFLLKNISK